MQVTWVWSLLCVPEPKEKMKPLFSYGLDQCHVSKTSTRNSLQCALACEFLQPFSQKLLKVSLNMSGIKAMLSLIEPKWFWK